MPPHAKICGLNSPETLDAAIAGGASHVGFVHYEPSPRHLPLDRIAALRRLVPDRVKAVLLLVNADPQLTASAIGQVQPDIVQFHGSETPEWLRLIKENCPVGVWKAVGVKSAETLRAGARFRGAVDMLLLDAPAQGLPGGNGTRLDWSILAGHSHALPWGLAGGLTPANVGEAIRATEAPLVDVSSGVERAPGVKDVDKIAAFLQATRRL